MTFNIHLAQYHVQRVLLGLKMLQDLYQIYMDQITECCPKVIGIYNDVALYGQTLEKHGITAKT